MVGHCRDTVWLGAAGVLGGWALQGYSAVGHCADILRLGTARYFAAGQCRDTWWLDTAGILCGWAHPLSIAGILGGWSLRAASSRARTTSTLESNNPTARVGKNQIICLIFLFT